MCLHMFLGVYLSRYSDLLQMSSLTPGTTGEIVIFKVMKVSYRVHMCVEKLRMVKEFYKPLKMLESSINPQSLGKVMDLCFCNRVFGIQVKKKICIGQIIVFYEKSITLLSSMLFSI